MCSLESESLLSNATDSMSISNQNQASFSSVQSILATEFMIINKSRNIGLVS